MCTGFEIAALVVMVGGAAAAASAQGAQGEATLDAQFQNAMLDQLEAEQFRKGQEQKAARIQEESFRVRSQQEAQFATRGIVVGEGSAQAIVDETQALSARDAMIEMYDGIDNTVAANSGARSQRAAGVNANRAAKQAATATLISGVSGAASKGAAFKSLNTKR